MFNLKYWNANKSSKGDIGLQIKSSKGDIGMQIKVENLV